MRWLFVSVMLASFAVSHSTSAEQRSFDILVEEGGKPLKKPRKGVEPEPKKRAQPKAYPRGSGYIPSTTLPRSEPARVAPNATGVYKPPPINSFSDRVNNCNHSFPLNAGIGNNPTDRSAYVRQCAN